MTNKFEGQIAVVTGSARGIGRGIAKRLAADGARILIDLLHLVRSGGQATDLAQLSPGIVDLVQVCDATSMLQGDIA